MEQWGFLAPGQYLIHDRDGKYCPAFQHIIDAAGVKRVPLPPRSPNLNAYAERWVRSNSVRLNFCMAAELSDATVRDGRSTPFHWPTR